MTLTTRTRHLFVTPSLSLSVSLCLSLSLAPLSLLIGLKTIFRKILRKDVVLGLYAGFPGMSRSC